MIRETFPVGRLQCNCSILGNEVSREAIVVDPGDDIPVIMAAVAKHGLTVKQIIVTHAHIDHIAGAQLLKTLTGAPILYNQRNLPLVALMEVQASWLGLASVPEVPPPDIDLADGQKVGVAGLVGTAILTPGHTPGSLCVYLPTEHLLLAGDTLFAGSVGRTDLPGGDGEMILRSIKDRLMTLPDETLVIPGHGWVTHIGSEREGESVSSRGLNASVAGSVRSIAGCVQGKLPVAVEHTARFRAIFPGGEMASMPSPPSTPTGTLL